jgi:hypothetical protein
MNEDIARKFLHVNKGSLYKYYNISINREEEACQLAFLS